MAVAPVGRPEVVKKTDCGRPPDTSVTVIVLATDEPCATLRAPALVREKAALLLVTVNVTLLLVPLVFITETAYAPGKTCWAEAVQLSAFGGQTSKLPGTVKLIVVPLDDARFLM